MTRLIDKLRRHGPRLWAYLRERRLSFSQYGEDALFASLLKPGPTGTYVDVGANHPVRGSNTFGLYVGGWSGLAVDPNPSFAHLFRRRRPRDIYLTEGVSKLDTELSYYEFEHDTLNTFSLKRANELVGLNMSILRTRRVPCRPLREMVQQHLGGRQIDLLSVDCEGLDEDVLESLDLRACRPTVLIVEDFERYRSFQKGGSASQLGKFLTRQGYSPIAQAAYSAVYIADDWPALFKLSSAYDASRVQNGYLPGQ